MRHPDPETPKTSEPSVPKNPVPVRKSSEKKLKIKSLPTQTQKLQERKLVNDQELLKQLRSKLNINSIQPEPEPELEPALNQVSDDNDDESKTSAPLLYLPAKVKHAEVHFMIDSGASANFLSQDLVRQLKLPTHRFKKPRTVNFADGRRTLPIQRYCLMRVPFAPSYQPVLQFSVADIAHEAFLDQKWLQSSDGVTINRITGEVRTGTGVTLQGIRKDEGQLSLMSACQFKKAMKNEQAFLCVVRTLKSEDNKSDAPPPDPRAQEILEKYADVFPDDLPNEIPPERAVDHRIDLLPDSAPVSKPTYKMSLVEMDELRRQLDDLLERGFIRPKLVALWFTCVVCKKEGW